MVNLCFCAFASFFFFLMVINQIKLNQHPQAGRAADHQACCSLRKNHFSAFVLHNRLQTQIHFPSIHLEASSLLAGSVREIEFYFRLSADARLQSCHVPVWLTPGTHSWASHLPISAAEVSASANMCAMSDPQKVPQPCPSVCTHVEKHM